MQHAAGHDREGVGGEAGEGGEDEGNEGEGAFGCILRISTGSADCVVQKRGIEQVKESDEDEASRSSTPNTTSITSGKRQPKTRKT